MGEYANEQCGKQEKTKAYRPCGQLAPRDNLRIQNYEPVKEGRLVKVWLAKKGRLKVVSRMPHLKGYLSA